MAKYKVMLIYTFLFFSASMTLIILGTNLTYEVSSGRQNTRPASLREGETWPVQKVTKGVPPVKIATRTEMSQGVDSSQTTTSLQIHWLNILGVVGFSASISSILVFVGAAIIEGLTKIKLPELRFSRPVRR